MTICSYDTSVMGYENLTFISGFHILSITMQPQFICTSLVFIAAFSLLGMFSESHIPCDVWDPKTIPDPPILPIHPYSEATRSSDIKKWLLTTPTLVGKATEDNLTLVDLGTNGGDTNSGIFQILIHSTLSYIVKISPCNDTIKSIKLNHTAITHPQCIMQLKQSDDPRLAHIPIDRISEIPRFAKVLEAIKIPNPDPRRAQCIQLLELAPGKPASTFADDGLFLPNMDKSEAILLSLGWTHGDPHAKNLFYDPETHQVTFIDTAGLSPDFNWLSYDLNQFTRALYHPIDMAILQIDPVLRETVEKLHPGAAIPAEKHQEMITHDLDRMLEDGSIRDVLGHTLEAIDRAAAKFNIFAKKFLAYLPDTERTKISRHFSLVCSLNLTRSPNIEQKRKISVLLPELRKCQIQEF